MKRRRERRIARVPHFSLLPWCQMVMASLSGAANTSMSLSIKYGQSIRTPVSGPKIASSALLKSASEVVGVPQDWHPLTLWWADGMRWKNIMDLFLSSVTTQF